METLVRMLNDQSNLKKIRIFRLKILRKMIKIRLALFFSTTIIVLFSCGQSHKSETESTNNSIEGKETNADNQSDSLIISLFEYGLVYFDNDNLNFFYTEYGKPIKTYKTEWCGGECDDSLLTTFVYPGFEVSFFEKENSVIKLERINVFDQTLFYPSNQIIGTKTNKENLEKLGRRPEANSSKWTLKNKTVETTVSEKKSNLGDTTIFMYDLNIDEFSIRLLMTKDTIREILWLKNTN